MTDEERQKVNHYLPLHVAAIKGDWESANKFIEQEPDAVRFPITGLRQTSLVVAIRLARRNEFVKRLIEKTSLEVLALVDSRGRIALHDASITGNVEAAKLLVQRNAILSNILDNKRRVPLYYAANFSFREMVLYLLDVTRSLDVNTEHLEPKPLGVNKENLEPKPFEDRSGVTLLYRLATSGLYDIALSVLSRYAKLAYLEPSPLTMISKKPSSFRSGTPLNSWQNLIYSAVPIKLETIADHHSQRDIENPTDCFISSVVDVKRRLHAMFWDVAENFVPQIKHIREKKLLHHQALELVKRLCTEVAKSNILIAPQIFVTPLHQAISFGIREIVEEILKSDPNVINLRTIEDQTIFQYAIMCRSESVFNLIYQLEDYSHALLSSQDKSSNNALHLAGFLGPMQQLKVSAAGPALQVQRELEWFKIQLKTNGMQPMDHQNTTIGDNQENNTDANKTILITKQVRVPDQMEKYKLFGPMERGSSIYQALDIVTNELVCLRRECFLNREQGVPSSVIREISFMREMRHRNILRLLDVVNKERSVHLVTEHVELDLRKFMDTSPEIVKTPSVTKIAGFGSARTFGVPVDTYTEGGKLQVETPWYRAPELMLGELNYSSLVDVWSVGCLFAEMVTQQPLFATTSQVEQLRRIFSIMGKPTKETWPGVTSLCPYLENFAVNEPKNLADEVPGLELVGVDLLSLKSLPSSLSISPSPPPTATSPPLRYLLRGCRRDVENVPVFTIFVPFLDDEDDTNDLRCEGSRI
ncbi:hypothetical protein LOK49_LG01G00298 [Camellia lanceoleosa]|uniref:Uncharacterized protein n=1 Tax=Camellia lanceoleosa TaxID=1840588 RepID=A0ACC0J465_9ERIC|nr:hypothetical protein LOK49_LG01G00298 [Camellia lanceoleosa]